MADEQNGTTQTDTPHRSDARRPRAVTRGLTAFVAGMGVAVTACGTELGPGSLGAGTTTTTTRPTTTTEPPVTTSTVDFDRPVDQRITPLPEEPTVIDLQDVVRDIRGPSDDVSAQMARLTAFVDIATLAPAQILDIEIRLAAADEDGLHAQTVTALHRNGSTVADSLDFLDQQLRGGLWNPAKSEDEERDGVSTRIKTYRVPGVPGSEEELVVRVSDGPDATRIEMSHFTLSADHTEAFARLTGWHSTLTLPGGAVATAVSLVTENDRATATVSYEVPGESAAGLRQDLLDLASGSEGYEVQVGTDESAESEEPLTVTDPDGATVRLELATVAEPETLGFNVVTEFGLEPLDP